MLVQQVTYFLQLSTAKLQFIFNKIYFTYKEMIKLINLKKSFIHLLYT